MPKTAEIIGRKYELRLGKSPALEQFIDALRTSEGLTDPNIPRFHWSRHKSSKGGISAPHSERVKDLLTIKSWEPGDTVRVAGRVGTLASGRRVLLSTFNVLEKGKYKQKNVWFDIGLGPNDEEPFSKVEPAYIAVDMQLNSQHESSDHNSFGYNAFITTVHGIEQPTTSRVRRYLKRTKQPLSKELIPDTLLVQGTVRKGVMATSSTMRRLDETQPSAPDDLKQGNILLDSGDETFQLFAAYDRTISGVDDPRGKRQLHQGESITARVSIDGSGDPVVRENIYLVKPSVESRKRVIQERNANIVDTLVNIGLAETPELLRELVARYYTLVAYPTSQESIEFERHPAETAMIRKRFSELVPKEQVQDALPIVLRYDIDPYAIEDLYKSNKRYTKELQGRNLLGFTTREMTDFLLKIAPDAILPGDKGYERFSLYRFAAQYFPTVELQRVVHTAFQPEFIGNQSDVELSWLTSYFKRPGTLDRHSLDLVENAINYAASDPFEQSSIVLMHKFAEILTSSIKNYKTELKVQRVERALHALDDPIKLLLIFASEPGDSDAQLAARMKKLTRKIHKTVRNAKRMTDEADYPRWGMLSRITDIIHPQIKKPFSRSSYRRKYEKRVKKDQELAGAKAGKEVVLWEPPLYETIGRTNAFHPERFMPYLGNGSVGTSPETVS